MKRVSNRRMNTKAKKLGEKRVNPARNAELNTASDYSRIFESAQYGILIIHAKTGKIENANHYILDLLGYSLDELASKTAWQLHSVPEKSRQRFEMMLEKGIDHWDDLPLVAANGSMTPVDINCSVYQAGRKKLVQCNIREITDLRRTEKSLQNLSHAIDASGDAVFMTDKDGIFTSINPRFTDLYGYIPEDVIGK